MPKRFPRLGDWVAPKPNSTRKCLLCQKAPAGLQHIQVGFFRGDDVVLACCRSCSQAESVGAMLDAEYIARCPRCNHARQIAVLPEKWALTIGPTDPAQEALAAKVRASLGTTDVDAAKELTTGWLGTMFGRAVWIAMCPLGHDHENWTEGVPCVRIEARADHPAWERTRLRWNRKHPVTFTGLAKDYLAAHPHEDLSNVPSRGKR